MKSTKISTRTKNYAALKDYEYIIKDSDFEKLRGIRRHGCTNTYKHSIRVAMAAEKLACLWHEDPQAAVRAGLLHDYCKVDHNKVPRIDHEWYCFYHPKDASTNAQRFGISERETEAIRTHMFPLGPMPRTKLGWIIRIADIGASLDETDFGFSYFKKKKVCRNGLVPRTVRN